MQEFWIRLASLFIVVSSLWGYNMTIDKREQENKNTQRIASQTENTDSEGAYKDGTYTGSAEGFGGNVDVEVTIEAGKISSVDITAAEKEDGAYLAMAEDIIPSIISAQSADVDTISGATFSSTAIKNATKQALDKAVK